MEKNVFFDKCYEIFFDLPEIKLVSRWRTVLEHLAMVNFVNVRDCGGTLPRYPQLNELFW